MSSAPLDDIHGVLAPLAEDTGTPEQVWPLRHDLSFTGCSRVRVASMYIGNAMLFVLNMPMIGMWVRVALSHPVPADPYVLHCRRNRLR